MFNPSDCHMECWRVEYLFINNCCFFTSASTIFVFEDLGVQSVPASLTWVISTSCQTSFHANPSFFTQFRWSNRLYKWPNRARGSFCQSLQKSFGYTITRGMCSDVLYEKLQISILSVISVNIWDTFSEVLQFDWPEYVIIHKSQKIVQDQPNILFTLN